MIYTVTFNPSLDYIVSVNDFQLGLTNRTDSELILPGGKGINVSTILMNLGIDSTAFGFAAGFTGEEIIREVEAMGIRSDFIKIDSGISRINLKLKNIDGTEINGSGPEISEEKIEELLRKLDILGEGDILVLAGSIPASMPADMYSTIMERLQHKNVTFIVDATKDLLINVLKYKPFLIKPNNHELGEIFGKVLESEADIVEYAKKLQEMGAVNVLISMAGDGAILVTEDGTVSSKKPPKGTVVNSVGAGDSMVAGFLAGWLNTGDYEKALELGTAAGSA
ncbi:MAG TPA: 1-phosphofructokinase, partial [Lachnospiraceae bacterium]|nr:1-phosphofructokinase [Lachnospiraceae bacterium]